MYRHLWIQSGEGAACCNFWSTPVHVEYLVSDSNAADRS